MVDGLSTTQTAEQPSNVFDASGGYITRGYKVTLDLTPAQERLLRSYCGAARYAYNTALGDVIANMETRKTERAAGTPDTGLTKAMSWSYFSMINAFNAAKDELVPWHTEVSNHCFRTGLRAASDALANWADSKNGTRAGKRVGFPKFKSRHKAKLSVSFVELHHQLSWLADDRHHVRLMLPQALRRSADPRTRRLAATLEWIHTHGSMRRLYRLVEAGRARIQKVTISYTGGRWQASFTVRITQALPRRPQKAGHGTLGMDVGITHLATLSEPVPGITDAYGHAANPRHLNRRLKSLVKLDRELARATRVSNGYRQLKQRRARLYASIAHSRAMALHELTNALLARFDVIGIEDLNVAGMARNPSLARHILDASFGELRRQLTYKAPEFNCLIVEVNRFYPSSKTCSSCGTVKAKLSLSCRVFSCDECGLTIDRDVNAAINLRNQALSAKAAHAAHTAGNTADIATGSGTTTSSPSSPVTPTPFLLAGLRPERKARKAPKTPCVDDNGNLRTGKTPASARAQSASV